MVDEMAGLFVKTAPGPGVVFFIPWKSPAGTKKCLICTLTLTLLQSSFPWSPDSKP